MYGIVGLPDFVNPDHVHQVRVNQTFHSTLGPDR